MTEWSEFDRTVALVWDEESKSKCPRCGMWEWQHDEDTWEADHYTCHSCRLLDQHERTVTNSPGTHDGVKLGLFKS